eukprot:gi/632967141/ref/XP_007899813.1/ PREDICTED: synaptonemal complex protein 1-like isoform X1 [Callorhinchus milii]
MVVEKDAELNSWKENELKINSHKKTLETELLSVRDELSGVKQQLKKLTQEKETLLKQTKTMKDVIKSLKEEIKKKSEPNSLLRNPNDGVSQSVVLATPKRKESLSTPSLSTEHKQIERTSTIQKTPSCTPTKRSTGAPNDQTPPIIENTTIKHTMRPPNFEVMHKKRKVPLDLFMDSDSSEHSDILTPPSTENKIIKGAMKPPSGVVMHRKKKVLLDLDIHSDSSEHSDILSMIPEAEMFKTLYKGNSQAAFLFEKTEQEFNSPAKLKSCGSGLKQATIKKMREAGWASITKDSRKKRMKAAEKLF